MKVAVLQFPGSNCDQDALYSLRDFVGVQAEYVWHAQASLHGFDAVFVPGGFTFGDYLRCGAVASRARILAEVKRFADEGRPVIGVCNGFQILTEAGILPGALVRNRDQKFICEDVFLRAETKRSIWTASCDSVIRVPIAHGEGRYVLEPDVLEELQQSERIAFVYCDAAGDASAAANPNGSAGNIAGVLNRGGNVLGLMPHPERACSDAMGGTDGLMILSALALIKA